MITTTTTQPPTTTTEATTTTTIPPDPKGWKRFEAEGISVVLPTSFKGGDPTGSAFKAQVKTMVGGKAWLADVQQGFADSEVDWLLAMFGKTSKTRWIPMVFAMRAELPSFLTLSDFTEEMVTSGVEGETIETVSKTDDREVYLVNVPKHGSDPAGSRYSVFLKVGAYVYWLDYSGTKVAFAQFADTYKQSIARIIVKDMASDGGEGSTTGTTASGSTTTTTSPKDAF